MRPHVHEYSLPCTSDRAFDLYTGHFGTWWHPEFTPDPDAYQGATIEPYVGGRVYFSHSPDTELVWGQVTVWKPGTLLVHTSTLAQSSSHPSEVSVRFTSSGSGCTLHFEHGGWNQHNAADRPKFGDWKRILDRYAALASG